MIALSLLAYYGTHSVLFYDLSRPYSNIIAYRLQTNAFLKGHLTLSPNPFGAPRFDYLWTGHGLQQNWGLGVPFLMLPFEWAAKFLGSEAFPDRLTIIIYLLLMVVILNIAFRMILNPLKIPDQSIQSIAIRWYLIALVLFSPGMGYLIKQGRWDIYFEVVFYGQIFALILLALFLIFIFKHSKEMYFILALLAGFLWLIRPTLIAYGLSTFLVASFINFQKYRKTHHLALGAFLFLWGIGLGLGFNHVRFGSFMQFGYSGIISDNAFNNYSLQFDYPFHYEPFYSAARELLGRLFFNNLWQSNTFRHRYNGIVFTQTHFWLLMTGVILIGFLWLMKSRTYLSRIRIIYLEPVLYLLIWALGCFLLLFKFYAKFFCMNERYLCDFSTALGAFAVAISLFCFLSIRIHQKFPYLLYFMLAIMFYLLNSQFFKFNSYEYISNHPPLIASKEEVLKSTELFNTKSALNPPMPESLKCGTRYNDIPIYQGYTGWDRMHDCLVWEDTTFFLPTAKCLLLNYSIKSMQEIPPVQVKRDLMFLKLKETKINKESGSSNQMEDIQQLFCADVSTHKSIAFYNIGWIKVMDLNGNYKLPIKLNWVKIQKSDQNDRI